MKKKLLIETNIKYGELNQYKRMLKSEAFDKIAFDLYLDSRPFKAILRYGLVPQRLKYDRKAKFKIYLDGVAKKKCDCNIIERLYEERPSRPILLMEILFAKERQEIIEHDNGDLEYHFTFLQY